MSAPVQLHHIAIRVHDLERCLAFYRDVLGLRELSRPRAGSVWLALGDAILMLEHTPADPASETFETERPGLHLLALSIPSGERERWERKLRGKIVHRTQHTLYVRDPEGNRVGLSHFPRTISAGP